MVNRNTKTARKLVVTGGLGFIGSHFIELALKKGYKVVNIDKQTYAARKNLGFESHPNYELVVEDIVNLKHLPANTDFIINFAAESHVDNAITANAVFFESNTRGVHNILELINSKDPSDRPILIHISTDEVYGEIPDGKEAFETDLLHPENPYSATKAAAEQLILGWSKTYGIKARVCRSSNNYGYGQYPEKLIAKTIHLALKDEKMTVHGDGSYKREWTSVEDNCEAILLIMEKGLDGEIYNISSNEMLTNLEIVKKVLKLMGKPQDFFTFVKNRQGQDIRYAINASKIRHLGWKPKHTLDIYLPEYIKQIKKDENK